MLRAAVAFSILLALTPAVGWTGAQEDAIASRVQRLTETGTLAIGDAGIAAAPVLPELYERRGFRAAWTAAGRLDALLGAIDDAVLDGLEPEDYHRAELGRRRAAPGDDPGDRADFDLLATDAFVRLAYHLYFGKVDPARLDAHWNFTRTLGREEAVGMLLGALETGHVVELLDRLRPQQAVYRDLRRRLAAHRELAARGGWPELPGGATLAPGARDPRVPALRARLAASGDLAGSRFGETRAADRDTAQMFDPALERAVRGFQRRHLLAEDGAIGAATRAALDVPIERRIEEIRINLERGRWVLHQLPDSFVVCNIAGYETYLVADSRREWSTRCQVGQQGRQTPIFRAEMRYLVFNPTWTVPSGILSRDILPPLKRGDLGVLARKKLKVIDREGRTVAPSSVNWSRVSARNCPYTFRQDAGPDNALGRVKFMFPNAYSVYLHDTPSKDLFEEPKRAFSSGCIRIERPLELAERVLADPRKWNAAAIAKVVESGVTTTVTLRRPLPVLLLYWTAYPLAGDQVAFAPDVYQHDPGVLKALDGPVRFDHRPHPAAGERAGGSDPP